MNSEDRRDGARQAGSAGRETEGHRRGGPAAEDRGINPTAAGGPATPVIPASGDTEDYAGAAGGGPHVGATEGSVTGVLGMGSSSVGHPAGTMGGEAAQPNEVPLSDEDGTQGIVPERNVSVLGGSGGAVVREAEALDQGAGPSGPSGAVGRASSGSTTDLPGGSGRFASDNARVGGMQTTGGPSADDSPVVQGNVRGAGARDEATERGKRDTATDAGKAMDDYQKGRT